MQPQSLFLSISSTCITSAIQRFVCLLTFAVILLTIVCHREQQHCLAVAKQQNAVTGVFGNCRTPKDEPGVCINIKKCSQLNELLLNKRREATTVDLLRKSHCGFEGRDPVVCCPVQHDEVGGGDGRHPIFIEGEQQQWGGKNGSDNSAYFVQCGKTNITRHRIINGQEAELGAWPWIAALGYEVNEGSISFLCGGTLITDRHVITAAHCILEPTVRPSVVRLGDLNLDDSVADGAEPIDVPIESVVFHDGYRRSPVINDIAIIKLQTGVRFTRLIRPICLPSSPQMRGRSFDNKQFFIIGWGRLVWNNITLPNVLQEAQIPSFSTEKCRQRYLGVINARIDETVLCAGGNGRDTCQGDSGGPLIAVENATFYLIGVVSYGLMCGDPEHPGVYTRVTYFIDWIKNHLT